MDMNKIKKLIALVKSTGVSEIEIKEGDESVRITVAHPVAPFSGIEQPRARIETGQLITVEDITPAAPVRLARHNILSPMVGTVYLSSAPEAKPFVEVGTVIRVGTVICLIEAMKMFNQIESDKDGVIVERLVENGMPVEFGQPLFVIEESSC